MSRTQIFVVGNSRSGTTMMGRILGNHESVFMFHEIHFFEELASPESIDRKISHKKAVTIFARLLSIQRDGYLNKRQPEKYRPESASVLNNSKGHETPISIFKRFLHYEAGKNGKQIPCDQTPRNLFYVDEILNFFPDAKVVNMIRDPRDVLLSQKKKWKRRYLGATNIPRKEAFRSWANYHPFTVSKLWNASIKKIAPFENHKRVKTIYFENLLNEPGNVMKETCDFLDIDYKAEMLKIPTIGSSSSKDDFENKGIRKDRATSWRKGGLTDTELFICQNVCSKTMQKHQYQKEPVRKNNLNVLLAYMSLPLKMSISLIMNVRRYKNIISSIKRRFA